jgi:UDP-2-acetamido-2,6-beta-L-arabino-hexul-4-ose reductase
VRLVVTGADGFIGRNLVHHLARRGDTEIARVTRRTTERELDAAFENAEVVIHLAGVNRPPTPEGFEEGNVRATAELCHRLARAGRRARVIFASSTQAAEDNAYGRSKRAAEDALASYATETGASVVIFRLTNVFGKWARPRYNSAVATFCHAVANGEPYDVSDPARTVRLVYVDDVVRAFDDAASGPLAGGTHRRDAGPVVEVSLGDLVNRIEAFKSSRATRVLPDLADRFNVNLYATYLSYLKGTNFAYGLDLKTDARGALAEFIKSPHAGQIFVSRTHSGITRGNHYHHTKTEKFLVVEGKARVKFRHLDSADIITHDVDGASFRVVDIPPGYTHSMENVGSGELVVIFWASEIFDPSRPDTYALPVEPAP